HHAAESGERLFVDLFTSEQLRVIKEIAQEPAELPQGFGCAIDPPRNYTPSEFGRLKDGEAEDVERFCRMPAILGPVDADEEHAVGHSIGGGLQHLVQALNTALHAAPSLFSPRGR